MEASNRRPEDGIRRRQWVARVRRVMPHIHVRGAHRQRDPRGEEGLCGSMSVKGESGGNKRPKDTTEHDKRELGIGRRETGLRVRPGVEIADIG